MKKFIVRTLATGFYSGYSSVAPGTAGTIVAFILYLFIPHFRGNILLVVTIITVIIGVWVSGEVEKSDGHDAQIIVIDEMAGMWLSLLFLPSSPGLAWLIIPFILFRLFDIFKPYPINRSQDLPGGWGVMADDVIAGIMANILTRAIIGFKTYCHNRVCWFINQN